jgi:3-oxoacyl-ACP reductase-like protein
MDNSNDRLLHSFQQLWINRTLETTVDAQSTIRQAILTDLKDELSHPRVRTTPYKKFYLAVKRIVNSSIADEDKLQLITLYEQELSELSID